MLRDRGLGLLGFSVRFFVAQGSGFVYFKTSTTADSKLAEAKPQTLVGCNSSSNPTPLSALKTLYATAMSMGAGFGGYGMNP